MKPPSSLVLPAPLIQSAARKPYTRHNHLYTTYIKTM